MGYLFLSIALFSGITKAYCGKRTSHYTSTVKEAIYVNILRMFFCIIIGLVLLSVNGNNVFSNLNPAFLLITVFSGFSTAGFVVFWILAVKKGAYMLVEVFIMLGVIIPMLLSSIIFNEEIKITQFLGFIILVTATVIMFSYNKSLKQKITVSQLIVLTASGIMNGLSNFSQKLFVKSANSASVLEFNLYTYLFAFALLLVSLLFFKKSNTEDETVSAKTIISKTKKYIILMAICLFANSYFLTKSAIYLDSSQLYPLNQGCALILSSLMSAICFRERITVKSIIGLISAFIGLIMINLL